MLSVWFGVNLLRQRGIKLRIDNVLEHLQQLEKDPDSTFVDSLMELHQNTENYELQCMLNYLFHWRLEDPLYVPGVPKKFSGLILNNSEANEAITLKYILLDRGKANLGFDISQLYVYKKLTKILMFKFGSIFLDVSKICEKRRIKY